MKYFPLTHDRFEHQFGIRAIGGGESIVEATDRYRIEVNQKRQQLDRLRGEYFAAHAGTESIQLAAATLICDSAAFLSADTNSLTGEPLAIAPQAALQSISRHVQEDLVIVSGDARAGFPMIAGSVCFPSGWSVVEKMGQSMLAIHAPVPEYASALHDATARLLGALRADRPVWRMNWGVRPSAQLDQSPKYADALAHDRDQINADNAGERCFFRVERQTLARIPESSDILFAIHTHQSPLRDLPSHQRKTLANVLQTCPSATLKYKGILPMIRPLLEYLQASS